MLDFCAGKFVSISAWIAQMELAYLNPTPIGNKLPAPSPLEPDQLNLLKSKVLYISELAAAINLHGFVRECGELITWIGDPSDPKLTILANYHDGISFRLGRLIGSLKADLSPLRFAAIEPRHAALYEAKAAFMGKDVDTKFPTAVYDIEEAGKCLALGRSTACVFHLMRASEAAAAVLLNHLGVVPVKPNGETLTFGALVNEIGKIVDGMPNGSLKDDWMRVKAQMHSCNRAYRTKVAHPVDNYTEREAESAFAISKSLLEEMAALL